MPQNTVIAFTICDRAVCVCVCVCVRIGTNLC